jgi:Mycotoxin biosynthesis protein UstYa
MTCSKVARPLDPENVEPLLRQVDTTIRVSGADLAYYNVTSLPLSDGGYASELFMTHELHCLKKVRQWIYKEAYFEDVQGLARNELKRHVDHCIETLRQGIMCRGDVSLGTYTYISEGNSVTARSWGSHQCVDFDALIGWAKERAVDIFQPGMIPSPDEVGAEHITLKKEPH